MSRGGMRWGAGRPGYKLRADRSRSLDVRRWARDNLLKPGYFGWQWTDAETGKVTSSISVYVSTNAIRLSYRVDTQAVEDTVGLSLTSCRYGGSRYWFTCPHCSRRCALLYLRYGRFRCRQCQRISYRTQNEDICGRTWSKQSKAEAKLGKNWSRPKGMHDKTYRRLLETILSCEETRENLLADFIERMGSLY